MKIFVNTPVKLLFIILTLSICSVAQDWYQYIDMQFNDSSHGWLISNMGDIYSWDAEHAAWKKVRNVEKRLSAVFFTNENEGFVCGASKFYCKLLHTTDGGDNWKLYEFGAFCGMQSFVDVAVSAGYVWALASSTCIIEPYVDYLQLCRTESQGDSLTPFVEIWRKRGHISSITTQPPYRKWIAGSLYGPLPRPSDNYGVIYYNDRQDGSGEWTIQYLDSVQYSVINSICFIDSVHGWACGNYGKVLSTNNGGQLWTPQQSGVNEDLLDIIFVNEKVGWIVGRRGRILHTNDGGTHWRRQFCHVTEDLWTIAAVSNDSAWVGGSNRILMQTIDGGMSWDFSTFTSVNKIRNFTISKKLTLEPNYPNPFNSQTNFTFELNESAFVELSIIDITGRRVQTLSNGTLSPGRHRAIWSATNVPSGVYVVELRAGDEIQRRKITVQK